MSPNGQTPDATPSTPGQVERDEVVCPREKSSMTPCVARDGHLAAADDHHCVGCGISPDDIADEFAAMVRRFLAVVQPGG